ncbi:MAG: kinase/pyrophosphorylase [Alphaproteobacteria bacterium]|nr:kinase/pyrophosphorylase [Alphaproteobacteria bacterium]
MSVRPVHLHLVSDATGETINRVAGACVAQFEGVEAIEHVWSLVRTRGHVEKVLAGIKAHPGIVLFTFADVALRQILEDGCRRLSVPFISVLDPVIEALTGYLGLQAHGEPGRQHAMDDAYFGRIAAMDYTLVHDDGQSVGDLDKADIVIVGVSRSSKTPTSLYLANRGYRVANIPFVPNVPLPDELFQATQPLIVGLTKDPERLVQIRRNRMLMLKEEGTTDYTDIEAVRSELQAARRVFGEHDWPVIDVTRRSIEETAAAILQHFNRRRGLDV